MVIGDGLYGLVFSNIHSPRPDTTILSSLQVLKDNSFQGLPESIIREISIGILEAVKFLNRLGVVHTDLKPENIILKEGATIEARVSCSYAINSD